ncbi:hypothetical protein SLA2020_161220 [Shorea laevis]
MALILGNFSSQRFPSVPALPSMQRTSPSTKFRVASIAHPPKSKDSSKLIIKKPRLSPEKIEIFKSLDDYWSEKNLLIHLKPVEKCWQPQDFLPDPTSDGFIEQIGEMRERAKEIPDEYFVVLVGNLITEEALPTYQTMANRPEGAQDETGASLTPWSIWTRSWTAEVNRHGDLLNRYLYLSGRVDMRHVEKTIQYLITSGMDAGIGNDPYLLAIYTSFQERATAISHGSMGRLAKEKGDLKLAQICGTIAADEKRHETAYCTLVGKLFEVDPNGTVLAFAHMMWRKITMPGEFMYDGCKDNLFMDYSAIAQGVGVYTLGDYIDILEVLVEKWKVKDLTGLSAEGQEAQEFVCDHLPRRLRRLEERGERRAKKRQALPFSWVFNRAV